MVFTALVLLQDFIIYPELYTSWAKTKKRNAETVPENVESYYLNTPDSAKVEVWHLPAASKAKEAPHAILFHGNAGTIDGFFSYQLWLKSLGISSWALEYRGFGHSSGWPREEKLYADAEQLLRLMDMLQYVPTAK